MSPPVLTVEQQKKSLSSMKRKTQTKNVLTIPSFVNSTFPKLPNYRIKFISDTLKQLLPKARIRSMKKMIKKRMQEGSQSEVDSNFKDNKERRHELLLGINAVSKAANKESMACAIFADDINPQLLIKHLAALCCIKNIPFIFMPNFRQLTKDTLGFSCIVLGFKKNFTGFLPVINLIQATNNNIKDVSFGPKPCKKNADSNCKGTSATQTKDDQAFSKINNNGNSKTADLIYSMNSEHKPQKIETDVSKASNTSSKVTGDDPQQKDNKCTAGGISSNVAKGTSSEGTVDTEMDDSISSIENCKLQGNDKNISPRSDPFGAETEEDECEERDAKFCYLYRDSTCKRAFMPNSGQEKELDSDLAASFKRSITPEFIPLAGVGNSLTEQPRTNDDFKGIGQKLMGKKRKRNRNKLLNDKEISSELAFFKRKRMKQRTVKKLIMDKKDVSVPVTYQPSQVIKMVSNPDRDKHKIKKMKFQ